MAILFMRITCRHLMKLLLDLEVPLQGTAAMSECLAFPNQNGSLYMTVCVCVVFFKVAVS